jgi:ubiquinone biosynthesis protein COQ9
MDAIAIRDRRGAGMIAPPERSAERDLVLEALLPLVPEKGWTMAALRQALSGMGEHPDDAALLFPGGAADMVEAFLDLADRRMATQAAAADMAGMKLPARVREVIRLRLAWAALHKEAVRRAFAVLLAPRHAPLAATTLARTVDEIWHAAGDSSADFSWYTKRAILGGVYSATLLFWLRDISLDDEATLAFLDRRLEAVGRIGKLRHRIGAAMGRMRPCRDGTAEAQATA